MLHPIAAPTLQAHRHHIEPVLIARAPVPLAPDFGHPDDGPSLAPPHALRGRAPREGAPRLHLHERHHRTQPRDQIQLLMPQAEAMRLDGPTPAREVRDGDPFAPPPTPLPLIFPLLD